MPPIRPLVERFWEKVNKGSESECWVWTAATVSPAGRAHVKYGKIAGPRGEGKRVQWLAHRLSWTLVNGDIPNGMLVDHRCFNTLCVNPDHLRLVTPQQNSENRSGLAAHNSTGFRGVQKVGNRFYAYCTHNRSRIDFGSFDRAEDAAEAARKGRLELMTHNDLDKVA